MRKLFLAGIFVVTCGIACVLVVVNVHAYCPLGASLAPNVDTYNFGSVVEKGSKTQLLTVTNTGGCDQSNFNWSLTGVDSAQYNIIDDTCTGNTISVGGTCSARVQFIPATTGYFDKAVVAINIDATAYDYIALVGTGITAEEAAMKSITMLLGQSGSGSDGCNASASTGASGKHSSGASAMGLIALVCMVMGTVAVRRRMRKR